MGLARVRTLAPSPRRVWRPVRGVPPLVRCVAPPLDLGVPDLRGVPLRDEDADGEAWLFLRAATERSSR